MAVNQRLGTLTAIFLAQSCVVDLEAQAPDEGSLFIRCADKDDCPSNLQCSTTLERCVQDAGDELPPTISGLDFKRQDTNTSQTSFSSGQTVLIEFDVDEALGATAEVILSVGGQSESASEVSANSTELRKSFAYALEAGQTDGLVDISVRVIDVNGNPGRLDQAGAFRIDLNPPSIGASSPILLNPAQDNLLFPRVDKIGQSTSATIIFAVTEPLGQNPILQAQGPGGARIEAPAFELQTEQGLFYTYALNTIDAALPDGVYQIEITLEDEAGNVTPSPLVESDLEFELDQSPPPMPEECALIRVPWGPANDPYSELQREPLALRFNASPSDGGETPHTLVVFDRSVAETGALQLARLSMDGLSGIQSLPLNSADRTDVYVVFVDAAGNISDEVWLQSGQWTASLAGKIVGSDFENPHEFVTQLNAGNGRIASQESPATPATILNIFDVDGLGIAQSSLNLFEARSLQSPQERTFPAMIFAPSRNALEVYGGSLDGFLDDQWRFDGGHWSEIDTDLYPGAFAGIAHAYDPDRDRWVFLGGADQTIQFNTQQFEFDGEDWQNTTPASIPTNPSVFGQLVYHPIDKAMFYFSGIQLSTSPTCADGGPPTPPFSFCSSNEIWRFKDGAWTDLGPTAGPKPYPRDFFSTAYHAGLNGIIFTGGRFRSESGTCTNSDGDPAIYTSVTQSVDLNEPPDGLLDEGGLVHLSDMAGQSTTGDYTEYLPLNNATHCIAQDTWLFKDGVFQDLGTKIPAENVPSPVGTYAVQGVFGAAMTSVGQGVHLLGGCLAGEFVSAEGCYKGSARHLALNATGTQWEEYSPLPQDWSFASASYDASADTIYLYGGDRSTRYVNPESVDRQCRVADCNTAAARDTTADLAGGEEGKNCLCVNDEIYALSSASSSLSSPWERVAVGGETPRAIQDISLSYSTEDEAIYMFGGRVDNDGPTCAFAQASIAAPVCGDLFRYDDDGIELLEQYTGDPDPMGPADGKRPFPRSSHGAGFIDGLGLVVVSGESNNTIPGQPRDAFIYDIGGEYSLVPDGIDSADQTRWQPVPSSESAHLFFRPDNSAIVSFEGLASASDGEYFIIFGGLAGGIACQEIDPNTAPFDEGIFGEDFEGSVPPESCEMGEVCIQGCLLAELWIYDGLSWVGFAQTQSDAKGFRHDGIEWLREPSLDDLNWPSPRAQMALSSYDDRSFVGFGGCLNDANGNAGECDGTEDGSDLSGETILFDISSLVGGLPGTPPFEILAPGATSPAPRGYAALASVSTDAVLMYGGKKSDGNGQVDDVLWEFNTENKTWKSSELASPAPPVSEKPAMAFDASRDTVVLFTRDGFFEHQRGAGQLPAHVFRFDWDRSGIFDAGNLQASRDRLEAITAKLSLSYSDESGGDGLVDIELFNDTLATWQPFPDCTGVLPAGVSDFECTISTSAGDFIHAGSRSINLRLRPSTTPILANGNSEPLLTVDYAEISVNYQETPTP